MCSPQNDTLVEEAIKEKVDAQESFTAWDITREATKKGANERHGLLKSAVHGRWDWLKASGYRRQTVQISGVPVDPWLYFPLGSDPDDYVKNLDVSSDAASDGDVDVVSDSDDDDVDVSSDSDDDVSADKDGAYTLTKDGRLEIPVKMVREKGWGEVIKIIFAWHDGANLHLSLMRHAPTSLVLARYRVNKDGRLRISPSILEKANLNGDRFSIKVDNEFITIKESS